MNTAPKLLELADRVESLLTPWGDDDMRERRDAIATELRALAPPSGEGVESVLWQCRVITPNSVSSWRDMTANESKIDGEIAPGFRYEYRPLYTTPQSAPVDGELARIGELIRTQDNRITDQPIFIVQQKRRIFGMEDEYAEGFMWYDAWAVESYDEAGKAERDADREADGSPPIQWQRGGYIDTWEFVTACFTEQGCKDYISRNGHNLREPRIYAEGSYRNAEWRTVRNYLAGLTTPPPASQERGVAPLPLIAAEYLARERGVASMDWRNGWNECREEMRRIGVKGGVALIAAERQRQVTEEGWTPEHDDSHTDHELALAAAVYATPGYECTGMKGPRLRARIMDLWPWDISWWKPSREANGRIRDLVKAGALIAAEIDRLQRASPPSSAADPGELHLQSLRDGQSDGMEVFFEGAAEQAKPVSIQQMFDAEQAQAGELPPLPECWTGSPVTVTWAEDGESTTRHVYTADQMRDYANACRLAGGVTVDDARVDIVVNEVMGGLLSTHVNREDLRAALVAVLSGGKNG